MVEPKAKTLFSKNSRVRVVSALFMLPIPIIAIWDGAWIFGSFLLVLAFFLMTEWNTRLINYNNTISEKEYEDKEPEVE